jgi:hypothetical protein
VVAEVRETLSIHKQSALKYVVEQFNMKKLIEGKVTVCSFGKLKRRWLGKILETTKNENHHAKIT